MRFDYGSSFCTALLVGSTVAAPALDIRTDDNVGYNPCVEYHDAATQSICKTFDDYDLPKNATGASVYSLLYGGPLDAFNAGYRGAVGLTFLGTNKFFSSGKLANPSLNTIVRPNVDTIYSLAVLDLAQHDLSFHIPPMQSDRFYLFAFYDPYGDNYYNLGSVNQSTPGNYLMTPALGTGRAGKAPCANKTGYVGCFEAPTYNGLLLIRTEVKENTTAEVNYVNSYLKNSTITEVGEYLRAEPLTAADVAGVNSNNYAVRALQLTSILSSRNPPQNQTLASALPAFLRWAGVNNGSYVSPPGVDMSDVYSRFNATLLKWYQMPDSNIKLTNGWKELNPSFDGSFFSGTNLLARVYVAVFAYLQRSADQAISPNPPQQLYSSSANQSYLITFHSKPPLPVNGFWSITTYDDTGYLYANSLNRYALGDRSNLTYPDGSQVYGPNSANKPYQILLQKDGITPPRNWTSNWLPGPANATKFEFTMRLYAGNKTLVTPPTQGGWEYPTIETIAPIKA